MKLPACRFAVRRGSNNLNYGRTEGICRILACEFVENMQLYCETLIKITISMILLNSTGLLYRLRGRKTEDWCNKVIWLIKNNSQAGRDTLLDYYMRAYFVSLIIWSGLCLSVWCSFCWQCRFRLCSRYFRR